MGARLARRLKLALDWHLEMYPHQQPTGALVQFTDKVIRCEPVSACEWEFRGWRRSSGEPLSQHHIQTALDEIETALRTNRGVSVTSSILSMPPKAPGYI